MGMMRASLERAEKRDKCQVPFRQHEHVRGHRARVVPELPREQTFNGRADEEMDREKRREIRFQLRHMLAITNLVRQLES